MPTTKHLVIASASILAAVVPARSQDATPPAVYFLRGDANSDGEVDVADPVFTLFADFVSGSPQPMCGRASDTNDDGQIDVSDAVYALSFLFLQNAAPPAPFPECGWDTTSDGMVCQSYPFCPQPEQFFEVAVLDETGDEYAVVGGDMVIGLASEIPVRPAGVLAIVRGQVESPIELWECGSIRYKFEEGFLPGDRVRVQDAMAALNSHSAQGVTFVEEAGCFSADIEILVAIRETNTGGFTTVGKVDLLGHSAGSKMWLVPNASRGAINHLLLHILGFPHEQQRPESVCFVTLTNEPVRSCGSVGDWWTSTPYDFHSVMHYGRLLLQHYEPVFQVDAPAATEYRGCGPPRSCMSVTVAPEGGSIVNAGGFELSVNDRDRLKRAYPTSEFPAISPLELVVQLGGSVEGELPGTGTILHRVCQPRFGELRLVNSEGKFTYTNTEGRGEPGEGGLMFDSFVFVGVNAAGCQSKPEEVTLRLIDVTGQWRSINGTSNNWCTRELSSDGRFTQMSGNVECGESAGTWRIEQPDKLIFSVPRWTFPYTMNESWTRGDACCWPSLVGGDGSLILEKKL